MVAASAAGWAEAEAWVGASAEAAAAAERFLVVLLQGNSWFGDKRLLFGAVGQVGAAAPAECFGRSQLDRLLCPLRKVRISAFL